MSNLTRATRFANVFAESENRPIWDTPVFETSNFIVTPSKGSLVPGWLLILPKTSAISFRDVEAPLHSELLNLIDHVANAVARFWGAPQIFEHGAPAPESIYGCGTDYAHLHLVPLPMDLPMRVMRHDPSAWQRVDGLLDSYAYLKPRMPYFFVSNMHDESLINTNPPAVSQYFRKIIASEMGVGNAWDYRRYPFYDNALETVNILRSNIKPHTTTPITTE